MTLNELFITCKNEFTIKFKDGTIYDVKIPNSKISGIIKGKRILYFKDNFEIIDRKNNLKIEFEEIKAKPKGFMKNWFGKKNTEEEIVIPNSYNVNLINTIDNKNELLEQGFGSLTRNLNFNDKLYWQFNDEFEKWIYEPDLFILPSSSCKREELKLLKDNDFDKAEKILLEIDNSQSKDNKLRKRKN